MWRVFINDGFHVIDKRPLPITKGRGKGKVQIMFRGRKKIIPADHVQEIKPK